MRDSLRKKNGMMCDSYTAPLCHPDLKIIPS